MGFFLIDAYKDKRPWLSLLYPIFTFLVVCFYAAGFPLEGGILIALFVKNILEGKRNVLFYASILVSFPVALLNGYGWTSLFFLRMLSQWTTLWGDWVGLWELMMRPELNFAREILVIYGIFTVYVLVLLALSIKKLIRYPVFLLLGLVVLFPYWASRLRTFGAILPAPCIALTLDRVRHRWIAWVTIGLAIVMAALFIVTNPPGIGESTNVFPPSLIQFMRVNKISGNVFNTPRIGGFLAYYLAPQIKTFSDTRDDLFVGTGVLEATEAFLSHGASVDYLLRKYNVSIVVVNLTDGNSFRDLIYDNGWALVYFRDNYLIFIQRSVAVVNHLPILDSFDPYAPSGQKSL
jgi:hypothetical protein